MWRKDVPLTQASSPLPARGRLAHGRAARPRAPIRQELLLGVGGVRAGGARDRADRLPPERGPLRLPAARAPARAGRARCRDRRRARVDPALVRLHDLHAGAGGERGLRREARHPLCRRAGAAPAGPAHELLLELGRFGDEPGFADAVRAPAFGLRERRLRAARTGRTGDVGGAPARRGAAHRPRHERRSRRGWLARSRARGALRFAGVDGRASRRGGANRRCPRRQRRRSLARARRRVKARLERAIRTTCP